MENVITMNLTREDVVSILEASSKVKSLTSKFARKCAQAGAWSEKAYIDKASGLWRRNVNLESKYKGVVIAISEKPENLSDGFRGDYIKAIYLTSKDALRQFIDQSADNIMGSCAPGQMGNRAAMDMVLRTIKKFGPSEDGKVIKGIATIFEKHSYQEDAAEYIKNWSKEEPLGTRGRIVFLLAYLKSIPENSKLPSFVEDLARQLVESRMRVFINATDMCWVNDKCTAEVLATLSKCNLSENKDLLDSLEIAYSDKKTLCSHDERVAILDILKIYNKVPNDLEDTLFGTNIYEGKGSDQDVFVHNGVFRKGAYMARAGKTQEGLVRANIMMEIQPYIIDGLSNMIGNQPCTKRAIENRSFIKINQNLSCGSAFIVDRFSKVLDNHFMVFTYSKEVMKKAKNVLFLMDKHYNEIADYLVSMVKGKNMEDRKVEYGKLLGDIEDFMGRFEVKSEIRIGTKNEQENAVKKLKL